MAIAGSSATGGEDVTAAGLEAGLAAAEGDAAAAVFAAGEAAASVLAAGEAGDAAVELAGA
ncbi:MAG TPA: hypothetical protein VHX16_02670 [Chloroflexota bacterium]|nr:hypothetical protein [Chloroflexota bacterium]